MNNDLAKCIGERIRQFRQDRLGVSQEELAETCGLHVSHVSRVESGAIVPRISTLVKICKALNLTLSHLIPSFDEPCLKKPRNAEKSLIDKEILLAVHKMSEARKKTLLRFIKSYNLADNEKLRRAS